MCILIATALALSSLTGGAELGLAPPDGQGQNPPRQVSQTVGTAGKSARVPATDPATTPVADGEFVIGPEDVLGILFWHDTEMSGDVTVRPDGMITLPLVRDIKAAGLTPTKLADRIQESVREYITDASVTVVVRQMHSRKVFITGEVAKPGSYPLGSSSMTIMQLIAVAGGLTEWAEGKSITLTRLENGQAVTLPFDYPNVAKGTKATQNVVLKPGDTIVVPER